MALVPFPGAAAPEPPDSSSPYSANSPARTSSPFAGGGQEDDEPPEGRMTFLEHLDELRKRITHAVVALLLGFLVAFAFINSIVDFVYQRLAADIPGGAF